MNNDFDVVIIGGGASGLAAAVEASRGGASVLVLEKNHVPGRKILSTGAGKCNFSNKAVKPSCYHGAAAAFLKKTFTALPPKEVLSFFDGLGLLRTEGENGRLFPRSMKAQDVVGVLMNELGSRDVRVATLTEAVSIKPAGGSFLVAARKVAPLWEKNKPRGEEIAFSARRVILAAGSPCYPQIGGTSAGYALLRELGHTVSEVSPAIVPLKVREDLVKDLDGVRLEAGLCLKAEGHFLAEARGELLFTSYGLSGPAALDVSRAALEGLRDGPVFAEADLFPDTTASALRKLLAERAERFVSRPFSHFTAGLHNEKVMKVLAGLAGIQWLAPTGSVEEEAMAAFTALLKALPLEITGAQGFGDAMAAAGGVAPAEVDPATFASKKVKGLYITGELLDVDGDSGGFNLHFAWTSGILAGRSAAAK